MSTGSTPLLGLALPVEGELSGTWGDVVNNSITSLVETAVAGVTALTLDQDYTLTSTALVANTARSAILYWSASGTTTRTILAPATNKTYVVVNATGGTQSIKICGPGPTTGVTVPPGYTVFVCWVGTDFVNVANNISSGGTF